MNPLFYELLQVALGRRKMLSRSPCEEEWEDFFLIAQQQAVAGVAFLALEKLSKYDIKPPLSLLYEWIGLTEQIKMLNAVIDNRCVNAAKHFKDAGYRNCILKGQGNAQMYPEPLFRTSGDIDIWLEGDKDSIIKLVREKFPDAIDSGMHLDYPLFDDVEMEVHYRPQYLSCKKYDKRMQEFFSTEASKQFEHEIRIGSTDNYICIPRKKYNVVIQMAHLLGHLYGEGVGLRQFVDMFYLLKTTDEDDATTDYKMLFNRLGMERFARGVMWIEKEILGLEENCLIVESSEKLGRIILTEVENGGNFGRYNERNEQRESGILIRAIMDSYRLIHLSQVQPSEGLARLRKKIMNVGSMKKLLELS